MTIPTPTSDLPGFEGGAGLIDVSALSALANEFFAALPSQVAPTGTLGRPASEFFQRLPGAPEQSLNSLPSAPSAGGAPALLPPLQGEGWGGDGGLALGNSPALAPIPLPASPLKGEESTWGAPGVPEAYAASLPSIEPLRTPNPVPPSSHAPHYFLHEASGYPATDGLGLPGEDRVTARAFGLPGEDELRALLVDIPKESSAPLVQRQEPGFYFTDLTRPEKQAAYARDSSAQPSSRPIFDVNAVRRDFPILQERVNGKPVAWFDNAATTHKPQAVIDRLAYFYAHENSNIHRAAHELAARATDAYEAARNKVARFLGASSSEEIIFVRGATEAINLIAKTWGAQHIGAGDEIVVSHLEHHANIVPWQQLAAEKGAKLRVLPVDDSGQILLEEARRIIGDKTRLVAITQVSNALGTVTPVKEIVALAHSVGAKALVDGAQSVSHMRVNVQLLDADFFVFSGHKIFGPTGIGVVYGKRVVLENMPPWQGGGNMIADVTFERTIYQPPPNRFEAGTGNIADAVGLGAALDYVERIGLENIARYEHDLLAYATQGLRSIPGLRLIGTAAEKASVASFVLNGYSTDEVGKALNREGIAVRTGHHCAQPILRRFGVETTVRPSLAFYNTCEEVDRLVAVVRQLAASRR